MWHRNITNSVLFCLKSCGEWSQAGGQKEPVYSMIHPSKFLLMCRIFPVPRPEWILRGHVHTPPQHIPLCQVWNTHVFWSSFKGRKKGTRWQELGNANSVTKVAVLAGISCLCTRTGSAFGVFQPKCSSVSDTIENCFYNRKYVWKLFSFCEV